MRRATGWCQGREMGNYIIIPICLLTRVALPILLSSHLSMAVLLSIPLGEVDYLHLPFEYARYLSPFESLSDDGITLILVMK